MFGLSALTLPLDKLLWNGPFNHISSAATFFSLFLFGFKLLPKVYMIDISQLSSKKKKNFKKEKKKRRWRCSSPIEPSRCCCCWCSTNFLVVSQQLVFSLVAMRTENVSDGFLLLTSVAQLPAEFHIYGGADRRIVSRFDVALNVVNRFGCFLSLILYRLLGFFYLSLPQVLVALFFFHANRNVCFSVKVFLVHSALCLQLHLLPVKPPPPPRSGFNGVALPIDPPEEHLTPVWCWFTANRFQPTYLSEKSG